MFEFSVFLLLDWFHTKIKDLGLLYYVPIAGGRIVGHKSIFKGISIRWNAKSFVQDLN